MSRALVSAWIFDKHFYDWPRKKLLFPDSPVSYIVLFLSFNYNFADKFMRAL